MKVISYGGGVQSTAMIVLAVQGKIPNVDVALFANVGDDSEHPDSIRYVREIARPYAHANDLPVLELQRALRDGTPDTLWQRLMRGTASGRQADVIPVRTASGVPMSRGCTADFKISVLGKWLRQHGATADDPATVCIGISTDEIMRVNPNRSEAYENIVYPLIDLGLNRDQCMTVIRDAGLPVPGKSSCYFCPFHRPTAWQELNETRPDLFQKAADLERAMNERRASYGREPAYLTRFGAPLGDVIDRDQLPLIPMGAEGCDSGYCFT